MPSPSRTTLAVTLACAAGLAVNLWVAVNNRDGFGVDFNQFYASSRLAGTGLLYDWDSLSRLEAEHAPTVRNSRLPVVAFGEKLAGCLPYPTARAVWLAGSLIAILVFALAWPGLSRPLTAVALCWSMPVTLGLVLGQDTPFWLLFAATGLLWLSRGRPRLAGAVFTLCICKYHLAVGLPILLAAQKRWKALASAAAAGAILLGACFWIEGLAWPLRYWEAINHPDFSPAAPRMANLRALAWWLPWPGVVEAVLAILVAYLLWSFCRRTQCLGLAAAGAAAAGTVLGHHGHVHDYALLIPLLVFTLQRPAVPAWLKYWAVLLLTPVPTLLVVTSRPLLGQIAVVGFVIAALLRECLAKTCTDAAQLPA
jgi:hypothetical protein